MFTKEQLAGIVAMCANQSKIYELIAMNVTGLKVTKAVAASGVIAATAEEMLSQMERAEAEKAKEVAKK